MRGCTLPPSSLLLHFHSGFNATNSFSFHIPIASILHSPKSKAFSTSLFAQKPLFSSSSSASSLSPQQQDGDDDEENFQVLTAMKTSYNDILIVDTPKSRMLLLDSSYNVHSVLYKEQKWTDSYWLIDKARDYFGLSDLEKATEEGGILNVHIGDVFIPSENLHGKYAGIVVDLFSDGKVLPQLQEISTWLKLRERLMPNGRFMVNCGGIDGGSSVIDARNDPELLTSDETWFLNPALKALSKAFPGQVNWKRMPKKSGENFMALTGPMPDMESWSASVPYPLSTNVKDWRPCGPVSAV
ncbi:PREDICTED: uncharacterized protein LOC109347968 isoform X3 [Lupinus angustifolius]|uniref:uncharacterized protein LOC109347968 isoform X3 n=1 Tax=Lupinus angustifolius TaxID=3871 RepID=UPI00092F183D|nr:PREDICTED: uncharacterized protein LOC109347968 isoform X3 [Lupinus angustifolius]